MSPKPKHGRGKSRGKTRERGQQGLPRFGPDVTLEEVQDVLADDGYSANQRKAWLKEVLTDLQDARSRPHSSDVDRLIEDIKDIIADHQDGPPISDDTL